MDSQLTHRDARQLSHVTQMHHSSFLDSILAHNQNPACVAPPQHVLNWVWHAHPAPSQENWDGRTQIYSSFYRMYMISHHVSNEVMTPHGWLRLCLSLLLQQLMKREVKRVWFIVWCYGDTPYFLQIRMCTADASQSIHKLTSVFSWAQSISPPHHPGRSFRTCPVQQDNATLHTHIGIQDSPLPAKSQRNDDPRTSFCLREWLSVRKIARKLLKRCSSISFGLQAPKTQAHKMALELQPSPRFLASLREGNPNGQAKEQGSTSKHAGAGSRQDTHTVVCLCHEASWLTAGWGACEVTQHCPWHRMWVPGELIPASFAQHLWE